MRGALRALRLATSSSALLSRPRPLLPSRLLAAAAADPQPDLPPSAAGDDDAAASSSAAADFDSAEFSLPDDSGASSRRAPAWDEAYRVRADRVLFGKRNRAKKLWEEEEERERALLEAALEPPDDAEEGEDMVVKEEDQKSLSVGIIGSPNAGKSSLTNFMVGTKVAAVSRKTNTTTHEVLGVMTKGATQIAVKRPWDEEPSLMTEEIQKNIALEVVREKMLDYIHQDFLCEARGPFLLTVDCAINTFTSY